MTFKILKNPITKELFDEILNDYGQIKIYQFVRDKQTKIFYFEAPICVLYDIKLSSEYPNPKKPTMYYNEVVINSGCGENQEKTHYTPNEILSFVNKSINESKTDKTLVVYAVNIPENMKGKRTTSPARKPAVRKTVTHKPAARRPARK